MIMIRGPDSEVIQRAQRYGDVWIGEVTTIGDSCLSKSEIR
jgi:hypothetical protein